MKNPIRVVAEFTSYPSKYLSLTEYMVGAFVLVMGIILVFSLSVLVFIFLASVFVLGFPITAPIYLFVLGIFGSAWYSWYREQPKKTRIKG